MTNTAPKSTADMVFANSMAQSQISALMLGSFPFPASGKSALCFYGTYGTGKTTYARIFCDEFERARSGQEINVEPHFVSCQKTEKITSVLKPCNAIVRTISFNASSLHYFIFDEVDNLTSEAQRALKAFLNTPNTVCVLTTNYLEQLDKGMLNRCVTINFNAADPTSTRARVEQILRDQQLWLSADEIDEIVRNSDGSWRDIVPTAIMLAQPLSPPPRPTNLRLIK